MASVNASYADTNAIIEAAEKGEITPYQAQLLISSYERQWNDTSSWGDYFAGKGNPWTLTGSQEKTLNNLLARYNSQNSLTWNAEQLQSLGLANSGVLQTGGTHTAQDMSNVALTREQGRLNRLSNIASSFIGMAGRMGSAGIHGAALQAVQGTAKQAASTLAHSASSALKLDQYRSSYWSQSENSDDILKYFENR